MEEAILTVVKIINGLKTDIAILELEKRKLSEEAENLNLLLGEKEIEIIGLKERLNNTQSSHISDAVGIKAVDIHV